MTKPDKILIIRLSSLGDIVLSSPLIRALKKELPDAEIDFMVKKPFADLVRHNPNLNHIISVDTNELEDTKEYLRKSSYDWVIDIQQTSRSIQLRSYIPGARITGYSKQKAHRWLLISLKQDYYRRPVKQVSERYFEAVANLNIPFDKGGTEVFIPEEISANIQQRLSEEIPGDKKIICYCPGAAHATKSWTQQGFIDTIKKMHGADSDYTAVLLGSKAERKLCDTIALKVEVPLVNLAGETSLLEAAAILEKSALVVANDSGLLHLAESQGTPVIGIYGPTVMQFGFYPISENSMVIEKELSCRPCSKMGTATCPKGHHRCMKDISSDEVMEAMHEVLQIG